MKNAEKSKRSFKLLALLSVAFISVLILAAGIYYVYMNVKSQKDTTVLAEVDGEKITVSDLRRQAYAYNLKGTLENPEHKFTGDEKIEVVNELIERKVIAKNAVSLGIDLPDEKVVESIKERNENYENLNQLNKELLFESHKAKLLKELVKAKALGYKEGDYILFRFDKYFEEHEETLGTKTTDTQRAAHKTYAKELADDYYAKLVNKSWTMGKALESLYDDKEIGVIGFRPLRPNIGTDFTKEDAEFGENMYGSKEFVEEIQKVKVGEFSKPFLVSRKTDDDKTAEYAYVIALVRNENADGEFRSYGEWLENQRTVLGVKLYEENISLAYLIEKLVAKAYAACVNNSDSTSVEAVNVKITVKYLDASDNEHNYSGVQMLGYGLYSNGNLSTTTRFTIDCPSTGVKYGRGTTNGSGVMDFYDNGYNINCSSAGKADFNLPEWGKRGNTIGTAAGHWENSLIANESRYTGDMQDVNNRNEMVSDLGISSSEANDYEKRLRVSLTKTINGREYWANGEVLRYTIAYDAVLFVNSAPTAAQCSPSNGFSPYRPYSWTLKGKGTDGNGDQVRVKYRYRKSGTANWLPSSSGSAYSSFLNSGTCDTVGYALGDLTAGTYDWQVMAVDSRGLAGTWSSTWTFTPRDKMPGSCSIVGYGNRTLDTEVPLSLSFGASGYPAGHTLRFKVNGNSQQASTSTRFGFNFTAPGTYVVTVETMNDLPWPGDPQNCGTITLRNPSTGNPGEVSP